MIKIDQRTLSRERKDRILERDNYTCQYCYSTADQVDHIIPWSYEHNNSETNLIACCFICNLLVSNKVFKNLAEKTAFISEHRHKFVKKNPICLWTKEEINSLGYVIKSKIKPEVVICNDDEHLQHVKHRLLSEGFRIHS